MANWSCKASSAKMSKAFKSAQTATFASFDDLPEDKSTGICILIIDDDPLATKRLRLLCEKLDSAEGRVILSAESISAGMTQISHHRVHVILLDKDLKGQARIDNGIESIPSLKEASPGTEILVVTASRDLSDCVDAMNLGATSFITKNHPDEVIRAQIEKCISFARSNYDQIRKDRMELVGRKDLKLPGSSPVIMSIYSKLQALAETNRPILLTGETGTGKTTAAKILHERRKQYLRQSDRPFLAVNIAAINSNLAERELFGHERGAFTDAKDSRPGFFELANGGTIFLDEIGEASLELQAKLLKVIDEGKFYRLGSNQERSSSFKLICATNRDLEKMVKDGEFREDLFMRISTFRVHMPSLAERPSDIPSIIEAVLPKCCVENNVTVSFSQIPQSFIKYLQKYPPAGNIRGLERDLALLFVYSTKKNGRPILTNWRRIPGIFGRHKKQVREDQQLSLNELRKRPTSFITDDFPGLFEFLQEMDQRVFLEASQKFPRQDEIAKALKISPSVVSRRIKTLNAGRQSYETR